MAPPIDLTGLLVVLMAVASAVLLIMWRPRLPDMVGYLASGVLLGPCVFGRLTAGDTIPMPGPATRSALPWDRPGPSPSSPAIALESPMHGASHREARVHFNQPYACEPAAAKAGQPDGEAR
jgi:hypothetical protein